MIDYNKYSFAAIPGDGDSTHCRPQNGKMVKDATKQLKREIVGVFRKFGYLTSGLDHEVTFKTTSGNIAWISIRKIDVIK